MVSTVRVLRAPSLVATLAYFHTSTAKSKVTVYFTVKVSLASHGLFTGTVSALSSGPSKPMGHHRDSDVLSPDSSAGVDVTSSFALLLRAREGDEVARNELCARYLPRLRRWAHGRLPTWAREHLDTEDIVQDALMQSVGRIGSFTPEHERGLLRVRVSGSPQPAPRRVASRGAASLRPSAVPRRARTYPSPLEQAVGGQLLGRYDRHFSACANRIASLSSPAWSWASTTQNRRPLRQTLLAGSSRRGQPRARPARSRDGA